MRLFSDVASRVQDSHLRRAITLAERGRGRTAPNPLVGCVIVHDGRIVGEGYHERAGEPHAEVLALSAAGQAARGADAYVTLEPCRHHGKTPPCTEALLAAGVRRVVIGMPDPTPEAGGGAKVLVDAGVEVAYAPDPTPFVALNEGWLRRSATGIPLVTAKIALSLDAHPAFVMGQRASISGPAGREITNRLRQRADAVLVGAATVIADDPSLTVRDAAGVFADHQPVRVVLVRSSVPDWTARVFADGAAQTLLLVPESMSASVLGAVPSAVVVHYYSEGGGLLGALRTLGSLGINEVLVEPGPHLMTSLWHDGLIDVLVTVTAGGMAGPDAPPMYRGPTDREDHALRRTFEPREAGIVGDVVVTEWRRSDDEHH